MLVYVDTNVWLNLLETRFEARTEQFFSKGINCAFQVVLSDWTCEELLPKNIDSLQVLLSLLKAAGKLARVTTSPEDVKLISQYQGPNQDDFKHVFLARKIGANIIATRNMADFLPFRRIIEPKLPEDI